MVTKAANSPLVVRLDAFPITDLVRNHWRNPAQEGQHPTTLWPVRNGFTT